MRIIDLIQKQSKIYRLEGQEKLRFSIATETAEQRIKAVAKVLEKLS